MAIFIAMVSMNEDVFSEIKLVSENNASVSEILFFHSKARSTATVITSDIHHWKFNVRKTFQ